MTGPLAAPCAHCGRPLVRNAEGAWWHTDHVYRCRDVWQHPALTVATPLPARRPVGSVYPTRRAVR